MNIQRPVLVLLALALGACSDGGNGDGSNAPVTANTVVVATRAPNFSGGAVSLVDRLTPFAARNNLAPTATSDLVARSGGDHYFLIERFGTDQISRFTPANPNTPVYTYSTLDVGDTRSSNPYDLIIVSPTKAYLLRYGASRLWIVNPSATTEAAFKIGEINLAQYDTDSVPEMSAGLIKDGLLYVAMQRLEGAFLNAVKSGYVAVIDTASDQEITTGSAAAPLKGIDLSIRNPVRIVSDPGSRDLFVVAWGGFDGSYNGGIVRIDPTDFSADLIVDDGTPADHPYGMITDVAAVSRDRAYFFGSTGFTDADQTLYRFNPTTSAAPVAVTGFQGVGISALSVDGDGQLWVGRQENAAPGLSVLGFQAGAETVVAPLIDTNLTPLNIDFITAP